LASKALSLSFISHLRGYIGEAMVLSAGEGDPENTHLTKAHETLTAVDVTQLESSKSVLILVALRPGRDIARSWTHIISRSKETRTVEEILATNIAIQKEILKLRANFPILVFSWHSKKNKQIRHLLANLTGINPTFFRVLYLFVSTSKSWNRISSSLQSRGEKFYGFDDGHATGTLWHPGHISKPRILQLVTGPKHKAFADSTQSLIEELDATTAEIINRFGNSSLFRKCGYVGVTN
jgi:hypothetical protein